MADSSKEARIREWLKIFVPLVTAIIIVTIGGGFSIFVANRIQRKAQERSNDIEVAKLAMEVLNEENPNLYNWLPELVMTIKDSTLRDVISRGVVANPVVPDPVKTIVREQGYLSREEAQQESGTLDTKLGERKMPVGGENDGGVSGTTPPDKEHTFVVLFMKGDSISYRRAHDIKDFLNNKGIQSTVEPKSQEWYYLYWESSGIEFDPDTMTHISYSTREEEKLAKLAQELIQRETELGPLYIVGNHEGPRDHVLEVFLPNTEPTSYLKLKKEF